MPRIDPTQLLKCLSVLLSASGGIKSKDEVTRVANLMTKFSKKLVSKCIYVLILKSTEIDVLDMFMSAGGWDLVFSWLSDGIAMKNWPFVEEIVELLLLCPVNIQRLKGNNCPKIIKSLSKDITATEKVRESACEVVDQWLAIVKGACEATSQQAAAAAAAAQQETDSPREPGPSKADVKTDDPLPVYKITIRDGKQVLAEVISDKTGSRVDAPVVEEGEDSSPREDEGSREPEDVSVTEEAGVTVATSRRPVRNRRPRILEDLSESETESSDDEIKPVKSRKRIQTAKTSPKGQSKRKKTDDKKPVKDEKSKKPTIVRTRAPESNKSETKKTESSKSSKQEAAKPIKATKDMHDKDRATLAKLVTPSISSMGRIPKKSKESSEKKEDTTEDSKRETKKEEKKAEKKPVEAPKPVPKDPKKYNYSTEIRKHDTERPKTVVKTFNSKFRSTGLEETPPPPKKKPESIKAQEDVKKSPKRTSPSKDSVVPEKKARTHEEKTKDKSKDKDEEKKITSPKPKISSLQESDMFADALTAANTFKDQKKRKRRPSNSSSKDDHKKESSPPKKPIKEEISESESDSKESIKKIDHKPHLRFYQDTLEGLCNSNEGEKNIKRHDDVATKREADFKEESVSPVNSDEVEDEVSKTEEAISKLLKLEEKKNQEREKNRLVSGILVYVKKRKTIKKFVQWRPAHTLIETKYFELDETERVNVTKTFMDMKQMERINEREQLMLSRKLAANDIMEERMAWRPLISIDLPPDNVEPGKNSIEKDIQLQRERTVVPAIYFNKKLIPDSPSEPDLEIHATTEPVLIPLIDQTGNSESVISYKSQGWPDPIETPEVVQMPPEVQIPPPTAMMVPPQPGIPPLMEFVRPPAGFFPPPMGLAPQGPPPPTMMSPHMWMNGDGSPMMGQPPPEMMMPPPGPMMPPDMGPQFAMNPMNPPQPMGPMGQFMGPPQGFQPPQPGPPPPQPPMFPDGPPPRNNRPWFNNQQGGGGGGGGGGGSGGQWRKGGGGGGGNWGSGKKHSRTCLNIIKRGYCKTPHCQFKHPPPYKPSNG